MIAFFKKILICKSKCKSKGSKSNADTHKEILEEKYARKDIPHGSIDNDKLLSMSGRDTRRRSTLTSTYSNSNEDNDLQKNGMTVMRRFIPTSTQAKSQSTDNQRFLSKKGNSRGSITTSSQSKNHDKAYSYSSSSNLT